MTVPTVVVDRLPVSAADRASLFERAVSSIGMAEHMRNVRSVFIKPNLTFPEYKEGVTTRAEFVEELITTLLKANKALKIFVGEGEGGYNSFSMTAAMQTMGFTSIAERHSNVEIVNLSHVPRRAIELATPKGPYAVELPELFFNDIEIAP